jgi:hypothetical protein
VKGALAAPVASVVIVAEVVPPAKVPAAPVAEGTTVKVTDTPLVGDPPVVTVATKGAAKAVLIGALCGVPPVAAMVSVNTVVPGMPASDPCCCNDPRNSVLGSVFTQSNAPFAW